MPKPFCADIFLRQIKLESRANDDESRKYRQRARDAHRAADVDDKHDDAFVVDVVDSARRRRRWRRRDEILHDVGARQLVGVDVDCVLVTAKVTAPVCLFVEIVSMSPVARAQLPNRVDDRRERRQGGRATGAVNRVA